MAERKAEKREFRTDPPRVVFSNEPATLVSIDGDPDVKPMPGAAGVSRVVNTPFILLRDDGTGGITSRRGRPGRRRTSWTGRGSRRRPPRRRSPGRRRR